MADFANVGNAITDIAVKSENEVKIQRGLAAGWAKMGSNGQFVWNWTGMHAAWCGMFVCWVVYQAFGNDWTKYIPKSYRATLPKQIVASKGGTWVMKPGTKTPTTTPQPGDIWAERNYGHTGLVYSVDTSKGTITTLEGNWSKKVNTKTKPYSYFTCIARPKWGTVSNSMSATTSTITDAGNLVADIGDFVDDGRGLYFPQQISKLYSSNNYEFLYDGKEQKKKLYDFDSSVIKDFKNAVANLSKVKELQGSDGTDGSTPSGGTSGSSGSSSSRNNITGYIRDSELAGIYKKYDYKSNILLYGRGGGGNSQLIDTTTGKVRATKGNLSSSQSLIEAPTIIIKLGNKVIGGYGNFGDQYPNYIEGLSVEKISGKINKYTINLVYQPRMSEDPNFLDKLLSISGFTNKITIQYGDSLNSAGLYRDDQAIITDVTFAENVTSKQIKYTITALSSIVKSINTLSNYPSVTDKPSNAIRNLFYSNNDTSIALLDSLPGMKNRTLVESSGLIPTDDEVVTTQKMLNVSAWQMVNYYVSGMYNKNSNDFYFLTIHDDTNNQFGGSYIQINKASQTTSGTLNGNYFEVYVGYPDNNNVMDFTINTDVYFPLVYKYNGRLPEWSYEINNSGKLISTQTNPLLTNNNLNRRNVVQSNWWKKVTEYPITAQLTMRGLSKPVVIGSYIKVNTLFYGNKDIGSGLYMVTGQTDTVSGNGCRTIFSLLRIGS